MAAHAVVAVAAPAAETPSSVVCQRCRGANQASSLFCRYCGASLGQASPGAPAPSAEPPAPSAEPPRPPAPSRARPSSPPRAAPDPAGIAPPREPAVFELAKPSVELSNAPPHAGEASVEPSTERDSGRRSVGARSRSKSRGQLVVITKDGTAGASYPLAEQVDIGRTEGDILIPDDPYLSPRHARVVFRGTRAFLRDLNSVNGLFLRVSAARGRPVGELERAPFPLGTPPSAVANVDTNVAVALQDQDLILIGQQVLRFEALRDAEGGLGAASEHGTLLFGTPTAPRYARLSQRTVEGVTRDVYYIRKVETVLGRESGDVVFTDDPFLSRRHAAFLVLPAAAERKRSSVHIVDLGSSNGTFLAVREESALHNGDLVRMGQQLFRVDLEDSHE